MIREDNPAYDIRCERQVVFNDRLECKAIIEQPNKIYIDPIAYFSIRNDAELITYDNVSEFVPFLEIVIWNDGYEFSYTQSIRSSYKIDQVMWAKIGKCVDQVLNDFEVERFGNDVKGRLFIDEIRLDTKRHELQYKRLRGFHLKHVYDEVLIYIKHLIQYKVSPREIASMLELDVKDVKPLVNKYGRKEPAQLAALTMLKWMEKTGLAVELNIHSVKQFYDEIGYRKIPFPRRSVPSSSRPWAFEVLPKRDSSD